jgi:hypothetical protein
MRVPLIHLCVVLNFLWIDAWRADEEAASGVVSQEDGSAGLPTHHPTHRALRAWMLCLKAKRGGVPA